MHERELVLKGNHIDLAALAFGSLDGPVVLALHGWLDNAESFRMLAPYVTELGIGLVALDLPGHGRTGHRSPDAGYAIWEYLPDVLSAIDQLDRQQIHLMGHSMGAGVASLLAGSFPQRVASLVLIEVVGPVPGEPVAQTPVQLAQSIDWARESRSGKASSGYADRSRMARARMQGRFPLPAEAAKRLVERGSRECDGRFFWSHDRRLTAPSAVRLSEPQVRAFLARISAPAQLYLGENGVASTLTRERAALVSDLEVVEIPGGHHPQLEAEPAAVMGTSLQAFYRRHALGVPGEGL